MKCIDWNGYLVYEDGVILNKDCTIKKRKYNRKGYAFSNFYVSGNSVCKLFHTIIAEAFLGEKPEGYEVDHIDNNRSNNAISNLQYLSKSDNRKKSYASGNRDFIGNKNPNSLYRRNLRNAIH